MNAISPRTVNVFHMILEVKLIRLRRFLYMRLFVYVKTRS
jgi:hypothetical protein